MSTRYHSQAQGESQVRVSEIQAILGNEAYRCIVDYSWKVSAPQMADVALFLGSPIQGNRLRGKHLARTGQGRDLDNSQQMRAILDDWFEVEAYGMTREAALKKLIKTFRHRDLFILPLAEKLQQVGFPYMVIPPTYTYCCRSCEKDIKPTSVLPLKIYICCILMQFSGKLVRLLSLCLVTLGEIGGRFSHQACLVLCRASPDMSAMVADLLCTCGEAVKSKLGTGQMDTMLT